MAITEGDSLPDVTVHTMQNGRPTPGSISDMVAGKKTVIFAVPGAFTPTCSEEHLPGFVEHAEAIKAKGVDDILCVAVNDPFVMDAWQQNRGADAITMVADGNGNLANALGLAMDGSGFGMGMRSQRYAMIVDDGVVTKLAVESAGQFDVSKAEAILDAL